MICQGIQAGAWPALVTVFEIGWVKCMDSSHYSWVVERTEILDLTSSHTVNWRFHRAHQESFLVLRFH